MNVDRVVWELAWDRSPFSDRLVNSPCVARTPRHARTHQPASKNSLPSSLSTLSKPVTWRAMARLDRWDRREDDMRFKIDLESISSETLILGRILTRGLFLFFSIGFESEDDGMFYKRHTSKKKKKNHRDFGLVISK